MSLALTLGIDEALSSFQSTWRVFQFIDAEEKKYKVIIPFGITRETTINVSPVVKYSLHEYRSALATDTRKMCKEGDTPVYSFTLNTVRNIGPNMYIVFLMFLSKLVDCTSLAHLCFSDMTDLICLVDLYAPGAIKDIFEIMYTKWRPTLWEMSPNLGYLFLHPESNIFYDHPVFLEKMSMLIRLFWIDYHLLKGEELVKIEITKNPDLVGDSYAIVGSDMYANIQRLLYRMLLLFPCTCFHGNDDIPIDEFVSKGLNVSSNVINPIISAWNDKNSDALHDMQQKALHYDIETESMDGVKMIRIPDVAKKIGVRMTKDDLLGVGKVVANVYRMVTHLEPNRIMVKIQDKPAPISINHYCRKDFDIVKQGIEMYMAGARVEART